MSRKLTLLFKGLIALSIATCTYIIIRAVIRPPIAVGKAGIDARFLTSDDRSAQPVRPDVSFQRIRERNLTEPRPADAQSRPEGLDASARVLNAAITDNVDSVIISAKVDLFDTNLKRQYLWSVRVLDSDTGVEAWAKHYDDQMFSVLADGHRVVTFDDLIPLQPGSYKVQVTLYKVKPSFDTMKLKDDDLARPFIVIRHSKKVLISR